MVQVRFLPGGQLVETPAGTPLQRIAEACGADIVFGCKNGSCGICRVRVAEGMQNCSSMDAEERDMLTELGAPPDHRLACRVVVMGDIAVETDIMDVNQ